MTSRFKDSSLMLAIIFCGTLIGAFAYTRVVVYPGPITVPTAAASVDAMQEPTFWLFMHPIVVLSLYLALLLNWKDDSRRPLILVSILVYCLALAATRLFFVREVIAFANHPTAKVAAVEWLARMMQWQQLGWMRVALMYIAEIALLIALMRRGAAHAEQLPQEA